MYHLHAASCDENESDEARGPHACIQCDQQNITAGTTVCIWAIDRVASARSMYAESRSHMIHNIYHTHAACARGAGGHRTSNKCPINTKHAHTGIILRCCAGVGFAMHSSCNVTTMPHRTLVMHPRYISEKLQHNLYNLYIRVRHNRRSLSPCVWQQEQTTCHQ